MSTEWIDYLAVFSFGCIVGIAELVSRYRDEPMRAISVAPSFFYFAINAIVSVGALGLIHSYGWSFGAASPRMTQAMVAGFGAMALLRSSLFTLRIGNQDVGIGPSTVVQALLRAIDAAVDRNRAIDRERAVSIIMQTVSFKKAYELLPAHCLALMQNLSKDDQAALGDQVDFISAMKASDAAKSRLLGLALMDVLGENVVKTAVASLISEIKRDP